MLLLTNKVLKIYNCLYNALISNETLRISFLHHIFTFLIVIIRTSSPGSSASNTSTRLISRDVSSSQVRDRILPHIIFTRDQKIAIDHRQS